MQLNLLDHTAPLNWGMEFSMEPSISGERQTFPFGLFVSSGQEFPGLGCFVKKRLWSGWRGCPSPPLVLLSGWQWLQLILVPVLRLCVNNLGGRLQTSSRDTKAESLHHFPLFCFLVLLNLWLNFVPHTLVLKSRNLEQRCLRGSFQVSGSRDEGSCLLRSSPPPYSSQSWQIIVTRDQISNQQIDIEHLLSTRFPAGDSGKEKVIVFCQPRCYVFLPSAMRVERITQVHGVFIFIRMDCLCVCVWNVC